MTKKTKFKTPTFVPTSLEVVAGTTTAFENYYGSLVEYTLMREKDAGRHYIFCVRSKKINARERAKVLKTQGLAAAHNSAYIYATKDDAKAFLALVNSPYTPQDVAAYANGFFKRFEDSTELVNETLTPIVYAFAAYDTEDELIAYNRMYIPHDTIRASMEFVKLYAYTSDDAIKKFVKQMEVKENAKRKTGGTANKS